jgi:hypothetical protein
MSRMRRFFSRLGLIGDRRSTGDRLPIFVGARLELDAITLEGTARDLSSGGVFFQTSAPLAPGLRGVLARNGGPERLPVRVSWRRDAAIGAPGGIGLAFE